MTGDDIKIWQATRILLNRFSVDTSRMRIQISRGAVDLGGTFALRLSHIQAQRISVPEMQALLKSVEEQIGRVSGVSRVKMSFENWERGPGGSWLPKRR